MTASPGVDKSAAVEILIVEDNPPDVYLLRSTLAQEHHGCRFHVVETGRDAFRFLLRQEPYPEAVIPDLVILDLNLPFRSGEEILDLIRETEHLRNAVVVLCSSAPREMRSRSNSLPDAYIAKPSDLKSYLALGKQIMDCFWSRRGKALPAAAPIAWQDGRLPD
jgi:CheY-like chemotaxis protein